MFHYDLLRSKGNKLTAGMKGNMGPTGDGRVEMSFYFITSLFRYSDVMSLPVRHVSHVTCRASVSVGNAQPFLA